MIHLPVLKEEVLEKLALQDGDIVVDCTMGRGGHSRAMLEASQCRVIGIDRDPEAVAHCEVTLAEYGERFTPIHGEFSQLRTLLTQVGHSQVDAILADVGVSSPQLDKGERGFSFSNDGPIDMRMNPNDPVSAADIVNTWSSDDIVDILRRFGEEQRARRIAQMIVDGRPWSRTVQLASAIEKLVGRFGSKKHPATRSFQALRIAVNSELVELERLLDASVDALAPGGRLAIICFHSLEDRIVKRFIAAESGKSGPKDPYGDPVMAPRLRSIGRTRSSDDEIAINPRARSATLRSAERI